jgi:hypothetical protein
MVHLKCILPGDAQLLADLPEGQALAAKAGDSPADWLGAHGLAGPARWAFLLHGAIMGDKILYVNQIFVLDVPLDARQDVDMTNAIDRDPTAKAMLYQPAGKPLPSIFYKTALASGAIVPPAGEGAAVRAQDLAVGISVLFLLACAAGGILFIFLR